MKFIQKINYVANNLPYRSISPINDTEVISFLKKIEKKIKLIKILNDGSIQKKFLNRFKKWIQVSKLNKIKNLNRFKYSCISQGTSQAFDYFYLKNHKRNFKIIKGDYAYHPISLRSGGIKWSFLNEKKISKNDAIIISVPFSGNGSIAPNFDSILTDCEKQNVPVMIDFCYLPVSAGINIDLKYKCIKEVTFSLSKCFPVGHLRIGMRLSLSDDDDPMFVYHKFNYTNRLSSFIGLELIKKFSMDFIYNKYKKKQIFYCKKLNLLPTNVVTLALGDKKWSKYKRANWNRLCLSKLYVKNQK
jgi:hypothetical protein